MDGRLAGVVNSEGWDAGTGRIVDGGWMNSVGRDFRYRSRAIS